MAKIFFVVNLAIFLAMGLDKFFAGRGGRRISEATLLVVGAIGGAPGLWAGMLFFNHKTKKKSFVLGALLAGVTSLALFVLSRGQGL